MWLLAGPIKCNWPSVTLWSVFQYPVTYTVVKALHVHTYIHKSYLHGNQFQYKARQLALAIKKAVLQDTLR